MAGRGAGKTRSAVEWCRKKIEQDGCRRGCALARTSADARDVMVEGESGFLRVCPPWFMPAYEPSKRRLTWPNGAIITLYSAEQPDKLRGPEHDFGWADEFCTYPSVDAWDNFLMGLRLGTNPQACVSTTPRPTKELRDLLANPMTAVTRGRTLDNADNLSRPFLDRILAKFQGTRLGRQELEGEILEDIEGAYWSYRQLDELRVTEHPRLERVVVGVDPAVTSPTRNRNADEVGIVVVGLGSDGLAYVLADYSLAGTPGDWAREVITAWSSHQADCIVVETNRGGELVAHTIRTACSGGVAPRILDLNSQEGKHGRAEPYVGLYEQKGVKHVGYLPKLEDEMCTWVPARTRVSPNRIDALVFALSELVPFRAAPQPTSVRVAPTAGHYAPRRNKR